MGESQFPPLKNISLSTCVEPEPARAGSDYIHRLSRVYFAFPVILTQGESRRLPRTRFRSQLQPKSARNLVTYSHNLDRGLDSHQQGLTSGFSTTKDIFRVNHSLSL